MNQFEFLEALEEKVRELDRQVQDLNEKIGNIKGLIIDYEFKHKDDLKTESKGDDKDVFAGHTPYFGMFKDENDKNS